MSEKRIEDCQCESCGKSFQGEVMVYNQYRPPREFRPKECPECRAAREATEEKERQEELEIERRQTRDKWHRSCGIPAELMTRNFDNFEVKRQKLPFEACKKYAHEFRLDRPRGYPSLLLYSGTPGVGKTHLMVAIANYIIDHWTGDPHESCPIRFASGPGLVRRIRSTYSLTGAQPYHEREEDVYREVTGCKLLMLDDVGKEKPSDFTRELYWYIIDERVKSGLPVVISSRLPLEGEDSLAYLMGDDTVDRLYGMIQGEQLTLKGESYRVLKRKA